MRFLFFLAFLVSFNISANDTLHLSKISSIVLQDSIYDDSNLKTHIDSANMFAIRLEALDANSPMDLAYNDKVHPFIESYLGRNRALISRMLGFKKLYFPLFESLLDSYELPLELKYLAIVESALNPKAKSHSGATGLWQFMYLTGREYNLNVTSYIDERQDPIKSTQAACEYFLKLYDNFGDWNLVLAAYNGGPGYLQRKINSIGSNNFWDLYPHLRRETRNYIPTFIAVNYAMEFAEEHDIQSQNPKINLSDTDTIVIAQQVDINTLSKMLCLNNETLKYLNPSIKKDVFPKNSIIVLPSYAKNDFLNNKENNYAFIDAVDSKEILINEKRLLYTVEQGDYLGRIAKEHDVKIYEIKNWNKLTSSKLSIGKKLVLFVKDKTNITTSTSVKNTRVYIVQRGDTLWGIAKKFNGLSVRKIKSLNNLLDDHLKLGTKIIIPTI
ncbi:LysM peptidoglycan-binding domain-containing protein [Flavobacteriales bacterium]|nr:LysM peptidoglycan-binding domain-containing protein [Flavobacteriales bacterium]